MRWQSRSLVGIVGTARVPCIWLQVIHAIIEATGSQLLLQIRRPATVTVMRSDMRVRTASDEEWHEMSVSLLTTRLMIFVTSEGEPAGEINLRSVTRLELQGEDSRDVHELAVVTTGETYMLQSTAASNAILKAWYQELQKLAASAQSKVQGDGAAPAQKVNMVWQQGYMEMSVGLDAWEPRFFTLSNQQGLLIYPDQQHRRNNQPDASVPLATIQKATRSTGLT